MKSLDFIMYNNDALCRDMAPLYIILSLKV